MVVGRSMTAFFCAGWNALALDQPDVAAVLYNFQLSELAGQNIRLGAFLRLKNRPVFQPARSWGSADSAQRILCQEALRRVVLASRSRSGGVFRPFRAPEWPNRNFEIFENFRIFALSHICERQFPKGQTFPNENVAAGYFPKGQTCFRPKMFKNGAGASKKVGRGRKSRDLEKFSKIFKIFQKIFFWPERAEKHGEVGKRH